MNSNGNERPTSPLRVKIERGRAAITSLFQRFERNRKVINDLTFMVRDIPTEEHDMQLMREIDAEHNYTLQQLSILDIDGQKAQDDELGQLHDDILHHINSQTDEIIDSFERIQSDDSDSRDWYHEHSDSSEASPIDNGNEHDYDTEDGAEATIDTGKDFDIDTEDGVEEHIRLIESNMQLITFLARQSKTIARL
jgi:hypothetical protein